MESQQYKIDSQDQVQEGKNLPQNATSQPEKTKLTQIASAASPSITTVISSPKNEKQSNSQIDADSQKIKQISTSIPTTSESTTAPTSTTPPTQISTLPSKISSTSTSPISITSTAATTSQSSKSASSFSLHKTSTPPTLTPITKTMTGKKSSAQEVVPMQILRDFGSAHKAILNYECQLVAGQLEEANEQKMLQVSNEEAKLVSLCQNYLDTVRLQQERILSTVSYPATTKDVQAVSIEQSATDKGAVGGVVSSGRNTEAGLVVGGATDQQNAEGQSHVVVMQRNRPVRDNLIGDTTYSLHLLPKLFSYKQLNIQQSQEEEKLLQKLKKQIFEIRKQPEVGAEIMHQLASRFASESLQNSQRISLGDSHQSFGSDRSQMAILSKFTINLTNLFYDDLYVEDRTCLSYESQFVSAFRQYAQTLQFKRNAAGNVVIKNVGDDKVVKILFEGLSRKISAVNFLRNTYTSTFQKINVTQIQEEVIKQMLHNLKKECPIENTDAGANSDSDSEGPDNDQKPGNKGNKKGKRSFWQRFKGGVKNMFGSEKENDGNTGQGQQAQSSSSTTAATSHNVRVEETKFIDVSEFEFGTSPETMQTTNQGDTSSKSKNQQATSKTQNIKDEVQRVEFMTENYLKKEGKGTGVISAEKTGQEISKKGGLTREQMIKHQTKTFTKIHIILGQPQYDLLFKLAEIFPSRNHRMSSGKIGSVDDAWTLRINLNQEINNEVKNTNKMLKDERCGTPSASDKDLQVKIDLDRFYEMQKSENVQHQRDQSSVPSRSQDKNLTAHCILIVHQVLKTLIIRSDRLPFAIRAMLKILVLRAEESVEYKNYNLDPSVEIKLQRDLIYLLAEVLIGCWLNNGFRNPNCFGVIQSTDKEKRFFHTIFQSCRIIFEHLFSMQKLQKKHHDFFDIDQINRYIDDHKEYVYIFYTKLIDLDLNKSHQGISGAGLSSTNHFSNVNNLVGGRGDKSGMNMGQIGKRQFQLKRNEFGKCLEYKIESSLIRFRDLKLLASLLKETKVVVYGGVKSFEYFTNARFAKRFDEFEDSFFLFTNMPKLKSQPIPVMSELEKGALAILGQYAGKHFQLENRSHNITTPNQQQKKDADSQIENATDSFSGFLKADDLIGEDKLPESWKYPIKAGKEGKNPAITLVQALYMSLIELIKHSESFNFESCLVDYQTLDQIFRNLAQHTNSEIKRLSQRLLLILKALDLIPTSDMMTEQIKMLRMIQIAIFDKFLEIFQKTCKQEFLNALQKQQICIYQYEHDLARFKVRLTDLQETIEKIVAQWQIMKISTQETKMCIFLNHDDEYPELRGLFLTKHCPKHVQQSGFHAVIAFDIFSPQPRQAQPQQFALDQSILGAAQTPGNQENQIYSASNRLQPVKRKRTMLVNSHYEQFNQLVSLAVLRPNQIKHTPVDYLEQLILYFVQESKQVFKALIRCDYLTEHAILDTNLQFDLDEQNKRIYRKNPRFHPLVNQSALSKQEQERRRAAQSNIYHESEARKTENQTNHLHLTQSAYRGMGMLGTDQRGAAESLPNKRLTTTDEAAFLDLGEDVQGNWLLIDNKSVEQLRQQNFNLKDYAETNFVMVEDLIKNQNVLHKVLNRKTMLKKPGDYMYFRRTLNYLLDILLVEFSQNTDNVMSYQQFLEQDMATEKIRQSCAEFILRQIHKQLFQEIQITSFDKATLKVIDQRKKKMEMPVPGSKTGAPRYSEAERDLKLYKISIDLIKNLHKEDTPRAKRKLLNKAFQLAIDALEHLRNVAAEDTDFLFSYLFYCACYKENSDRHRQIDQRVFSQLLFTFLFDPLQRDMKAENEEGGDRGFTSDGQQMMSGQERGLGGVSLDDNTEGTGDNVDQFFVSLFIAVKEDLKVIGAKYVSYSSFI